MDINAVKIDFRYCRVIVFFAGINLHDLKFKNEVWAVGIMSKGSDSEFLGCFNIFEVQNPIGLMFEEK